jgi:ABC-type thiamin/hydroxymethylpyrimidine transport system permease subunit
MSDNGVLEIFAGGVNSEIYDYYIEGSYGCPHPFSLSLSLTVFLSSLLCAFFFSASF